MASDTFVDSKVYADNSGVVTYRKGNRERSIIFSEGGVIVRNESSQIAFTEDEFSDFLTAYFKFRNDLTPSTIAPSWITISEVAETYGCNHVSVLTTIKNHQSKNNGKPPEWAVQSGKTWLIERGEAERRWGSSNN
jgi:hypothetical protein